MAEGLIQDKMAQPEGENLTADQIKQNIKMPPELQTAYEKVVIAGMKVMFTKESHQFMLRELQGQGSMGEKLGKGIAGLLLVLFKESNGSMPPQVMVPAGVELVMQAAEFVKKSGLGSVTDKDVADGIESMISILLQKFGVDSGGFRQMLDQYDTSNIQAQAGQMTGGAAPQPGA